MDLNGTRISNELLVVRLYTDACFCTVGNIQIMEKLQTVPGSQVVNQHTLGSVAYHCTRIPSFKRQVNSSTRTFGLCKKSCWPLVVAVIWAKWMTAGNWLPFGNWLSVEPPAYNACRPIWQRKDETVVRDCQWEAIIIIMTCVPIIFISGEWIWQFSWQSSLSVIWFCLGWVNPCMW